MGFPDAKWAVDQIVSKIGVQPNNMRKFTAVSKSETQIALQFTEPEDSRYSEGGAIAATTKGVVIRMSTEDYPQTPNDGTLVVNNTNLGAYSNTDFIVSGLTKDVPVYFSAFPYSTIGVYNESLAGANKAMATPKSAEIVNVVINVTDVTEFTGATVTLRNINTQETVVKQMGGPGTVQFDAEQGNTFVVEVSEVTAYSVDKLQSEQFTAVAGGTRTIEFTYTYGFLYTITFDNGADGIPSSFEYSDDAAGFTPASVSDMGSWANSPILDKFRPCVIKPGATSPEYYLNKNNYNQRETGTTAPILTGADGDVMVEIAKMWYKVTKNSSAKTITLSISEIPREGFSCFNEVAGQELDFVYKGCYDASESDGQMRSVSGVAPAVSKTRAQFRTLARARGNEYSQNDYYLVFLYECMYIMLYGTRDSQTAIGRGRSASGNNSAINTGTMNDKPFCWGDTGGTNGMKFLGVENFYGNIWHFVDGLTIVELSAKVTRDPSKYDDVGTNYETTIGNVPSGASGSYIKEMHGNNDGIFLPSAVGGSETTYYCDALWTNTGTRVAWFGGNWNSAGKVGAFCCYLRSDASSSSASLGSRLCRKKVG